MKTLALTPKREICWLEIIGSTARITHHGDCIQHECSPAELAEATRAYTARDVTAFGHTVIGYLTTETTSLGGVT